MSKALIIGLTGQTGAGKGVVASICRRWGIPSIDTDEVYHTLLIPPSACLDELVAAFGAGILKTDGSLDRPALAAIVFSPDGTEKRELLNRITHRYVLEAVRATCQELAAQGVPAVLVDAPLLYESGFDKECDRVLAVLASPDVRLCRIMARDGLSLAAATARMQAQKPDGFYHLADGVLYNDGNSPDELIPHLRRLLSEWGVPLP